MSDKVTEYVESQPKRRKGELTEAGIIMESGEVINSGHVFALAQKCQQFLQEGKTLEFEEAVYGKRFWEHIHDQEYYNFESPERVVFTDEEHHIFLGTAVVFEGTPWRISRLLSHFEYDRISSDVKINKED